MIASRTPPDYEGALLKLGWFILAAILMVGIRRVMDFQNRPRPANRPILRRSAGTMTLSDTWPYGRVS